VTYALMLMNLETGHDDFSPRISEFTVHNHPVI